MEDENPKGSVNCLIKQVGIVTWRAFWLNVMLRLSVPCLAWKMGRVEWLCTKDGGGVI